MNRPQRLCDPEREAIVYFQGHYSTLHMYYYIDIIIL